MTVNRIIGFGVAPFASSSSTLRYAILAEKFGLSSFWLGEGYHGRSAIALLSAIASQTKRITLGTSIIGVYTRHPGLLAMEAATIDEISGGRFILGLGVNVSSLVKHGLIKSAGEAKEQKPYSAMRDSIAIIKSLLKGEKTVYNGQVFSLPEPGSTLNFHGFSPVRKNLPIYIGSRSPMILELAGRTCEGVILSRAMSASGSYVRQSISSVEKGAKGAGKNLSDVVIAANLTISVDRDSEKAKEHVREAVALYVADPTLKATDLMLQHSKVKPEDLETVKKGYAEGGMRKAEELLTPEMIDEFSIAGTPDECVAKVEKLAELGIKIPIAFDIIGPNPEIAIELIAKEMEPRLVGSN